MGRRRVEGGQVAAVAGQQQAAVSASNGVVDLTSMGVDPAVGALLGGAAPPPVSAPAGMPDFTLSPVSAPAGMPDFTALADPAEIAPRAADAAAHARAAAPLEPVRQASPGAVVPAAAPAEVAPSLRPAVGVPVESANAPGARGGACMVVETIAVVDVAAEHAHLLAALKLGESRSDRAIVKKALDEASDNARRAMVLHIAACLERKRIEREHGTVLAPMRARARDDLAREKESGALKKTITNDDVESRMRELFADEYDRQEERLALAKRAEDYFEGFSAIWRSRCADVRALLQSYAPTA